MVKLLRAKREKCAIKKAGNWTQREGPSPPVGTVSYLGKEGDFREGERKEEEIRTGEKSKKEKMMAPNSRVFH